MAVRWKSTVKRSTSGKEGGREVVMSRGKKGPTRFAMRRESMKSVRVAEGGKADRVGEEEQDGRAPPGAWRLAARR